MKLLKAGKNFVSKNVIPLLSDNFFHYRMSQEGRETKEKTAFRCFSGKILKQVFQRLMRFTYIVNKITDFLNFPLLKKEF